METNIGLAERIKNDYLPVGKSQIGEKLATIKELAARYGVSCPTIGKAISALSQQGWVHSKQGSGVYVARLYDNNQNHSSSAHYPKIGYVAYNMRMRFTNHIMEGIQYTANRNNYTLVVGSSNGKIDEEKRHIANMQQQGVKGIILYPLPRLPQDSEYLNKDFQGFPIVIVDLYDQSMNRPRVVFDNYSAGRAVTKYLVEQGRKHIVFLDYPSFLYSSVRDRIAGYKRALEDAGILFVPEMIVKFADKYWPIPSEIIPLSVAIKQVTSGEKVPDAVILPSDVHVPETIDCLEKIGFAVPEDIMVASFDNLGYSKHGFQWPTTNPDLVRMGEYAAEKVLRLLSSDSKSEVSESILPCPLVIPESQHYFDMVGELPHACRSRPIIPVNTIRSHNERKLTSAL